MPKVGVILANDRCKLGTWPWSMGSLEVDPNASYTPFWPIWIAAPGPAKPGVILYEFYTIKLFLKLYKNFIPIFYENVVITIYRITPLGI